jgi:hypothetical protein
VYQQQEINHLHRVIEEHKDTIMLLDSNLQEFNIIQHNRKELIYFLENSWEDVRGKLADVINNQLQAKTYLESNPTTITAHEESFWTKLQTNPLPKNYFRNLSARERESLLRYLLQRVTTCFELTQERQKKTVQDAIQNNNYIAIKFPSIK